MKVTHDKTYFHLKKPLINMLIDCFGLGVSRYYYIDLIYTRHSTLFTLNQDFITNSVFGRGPFCGLAVSYLSDFPGKIHLFSVF